MTGSPVNSNFFCLPTGMIGIPYHSSETVLPCHAVNVSIVELLVQSPPAMQQTLSAAVDSSI